MLSDRLAFRVAALFSLFLIWSWEGNLFAGESVAVPERTDAWSVFILNDNCPDYTWGIDEQIVRKCLAELVAAHLDVMNQTDDQPPENRDRYNMAIVQEALCFVERYPERKDELIRRIHEGRVFVSPFLCNTLWGMHSIEQALRAMYPARRLADEWDFPLDMAHHIEEPSLPWGVVTLMAGSGIRWLNIPFLDFDSTFATLSNPPLFTYEGPDGSSVRVIMDPWASLHGSYFQGRVVLKKRGVFVNDWLPHYRGLKPDYPGYAILASGTHSDIWPGRSAAQAPGFAQDIINYNKQPGDHPKLVNATLPMFCEATDTAIKAGGKLPVVRGSFGHSWELWPVSLAKYVADMRQAESDFIAAESLLAVALRIDPRLGLATRTKRQRAEWLLAMLSDHAWNGTELENRRHNAGLRKEWAAELARLAAQLQSHGRAIITDRLPVDDLVVFNSLSVPRSDLVRLEAGSDLTSVRSEGRILPCQVVEENGHLALYFLAPETPGFGFSQLKIKEGPSLRNEASSPHLTASATELDGPFYKLKVNPKTGTVASLIHKASGRELVSDGEKIGLGRVVYHDITDHDLENVTCSLVANGPVLARIKIAGEIPAAKSSVINYITLYADLDRVDFDFHLSKPPTDKQEHLCHIFPVLSGELVLRIETPAAVIRPRLQPEGDLLSGADTKRFAIQCFVDLSFPDGPGITVCPVDSYMLRQDGSTTGITFEALGNDQNYKEVIHDQNGEREFRFRYSLRAHDGPFERPEAFTFSRTVRTPLMLLRGKVAADLAKPFISIPAERAIATCLKPAEDMAPGAVVFRVWETAGSTEPLTISMPGVRKAFLCDLLERVREEIPVRNEKIVINPKPYGLVCVKFLSGGLLGVSELKD